MRNMAASMTIAEIHADLKEQNAKFAGELLQLARCGEAAEQMESLYGIWDGVNHVVMDLEEHLKGKDWRPCQQ